MRILGCVVGLVLLVSSAVPARAMNWSLGANLGYTMVQPADKYNPPGGPKLDNVNVFSWPTAGIVNPVLGNELPFPGLRIGFTGEKPTHEVYIDTGLRIASAGDISSRGVFVSGNYQFNFSMSGSVVPYLTAGAGFVMAGEKDKTDPTDVIDVSATGATFGGGVGVRHKMGNGHATLRAEVRFDRMTEGTDTIGGVDVPIVPESNLIGVKLGFDFWDK